MASDWIDIARRDNDILFTVRQNKQAPLKAWLTTAAVAVTLILLVWIIFASAEKGDGLGILGLLIGFFAVIATLIAVASALYLIPAWLLRPEQAVFAISPAEISLIEKAKRSGPDSVARAEIVSIFAGQKVKQAPPLQTHTIAVGSPGMVAAVTAASAASGVAAGAGQSVQNYLAKYGFAVGVNARGKEVLLAHYLTEEQAEYLYTRVKEVLEAGAP